MVVKVHHTFDRASSQMEAKATIDRVGIPAEDGDKHD